MFRKSGVSLRAVSIKSKYLKGIERRNRLKQNFAPVRQTAKGQYDLAKKAYSKRGGDPNDQHGVFSMMDKMYGSKSGQNAASMHKRVEMQNSGANSLYALQSGEFGDETPLSVEQQSGFTESQAQLFRDGEEMMAAVAPPSPYTKLTARRIAEGEAWPEAPAWEDRQRTLSALRHPDDMSPSAQKMSRNLEYWLRRQLKSCPAHISENIDWTQFMLDEVIASQRSKQVFILWSTIHPGARYQIEPHLTPRLNSWIIEKVILRYTKHHPNIPRIVWVYNQGIARKLPKKLLREARNVNTDAMSTIDERVKYLRSMDSVKHKLKGVPWFMPYLWSKDAKLREKRQMVSDVEEVEKRKVSKARGSQEGLMQQSQFLR